MKGLLDRVDNPQLNTDITLDKCLKSEMADHLKASNVVIQFLAIKLLGFTILTAAKVLPYSWS